MTGCLQIKGNKYYAVVDMTDENGARKRKWISTGISVEGNNKRAANKKLREIISEIESQKIAYSTEISFVDWLEKWMDMKRSNIRQSTYESYSFFLNVHVKPYFKIIKVTVNSIAPQHIQDYVNQKVKEGLSGNTVRKHIAIIRGALGEAVRKNIISFNPAERVTLPAKKKYVSKAYTMEEANALLKAVENEPIKPAVILGLFYGLRRSEVLGLRWKDIDFEANTIHVCNTVVRCKTKIIEENTKSEASDRRLFIIPSTRDYFLTLRKQQIENRLLLGSAYHANDFVCVWRNGKPFSPSFISEKFRNLLIQNGLPRIRFHELRHTAGSLLLEQNLSMKQIQEYLGHEKISTTMDIYGHLSMEGKQQASKTMDGILLLETV